MILNPENLVIKDGLDQGGKWANSRLFQYSDEFSKKEDANETDQEK